MIKKTTARTTGAKAAPKKTAAKKKVAPAAKKKVAPAARKKVAPAARKVARARKRVAPAPKAVGPAPKKVAVGPRPETRDEVFAGVEARASAVGVVLQKGVTKTALKAAEAALGVTLPDDVRAWFLRHDGAKGEAIRGEELLGLRHVVSQWKIWQGLLDKGTFADNRSKPARGVRPDWWNARWIPLTYDGAGNHDCLDLDPAKGGNVGQVIRMWHDDDPRPRVAPTFLDWLWRAPWGAGP
jgi:cell wall assembly regulator SMI1